MDNINFKYLKYKAKYLDLKNQFGGTGLSRNIKLAAVPGMPTSSRNPSNSEISQLPFTVSTGGTGLSRNINLAAGPGMPTSSRNPSNSEILQLPLTVSTGAAAAEEPLEGIGVLTYNIYWKAMSGAGGGFQSCKGEKSFQCRQNVANLIDSHGNNYCKTGRIGPIM